MATSSRSQIEAIGRAGVEALERRDGATARRRFEEMIAAGAETAPAFVLLAQSCRLIGDEEAERAAIERVLEIDPRNMRGLIMRGDAYQRAGDDRAANSFYQHALRLASAAAGIPPGLQAELQRTAAELEQIRNRYQQELRKTLLEGETPPSPRVRESIEIMLGEKKVYLQEPTSFYFAGLPQIQFYEPEDFPWIKSIEAAAPAMRAELEEVLRDESRFRPYVQPPKDRAYDDTYVLLNSTDWKALYLWEGGELVEENARRCPRTVAALEQAPMPCIRTRSPMALFSLLRPGAHIPPHNGMLNTRLICHIPLIVPPDCRLRVGNEIREVVEGKAMIFDDSIEHEAWNGSDRTRVVLLFEIWRPEIGEDERRQLTTMYEAVNAYGMEPPAAH